MTSVSSNYSRIERRETSSPRSALAITLAVIVIILCAYAALETVLAMTGQPALLAAPAAMGSAIVNLAALPSWVLLVAGGIVVVLGLLLLVAAVTPGHRPRHTMPTGRIVTLVDDEVTASSLARQASYEGNVDPDNARVSMSRRRAVVTLTATSGKKVVTQPVKDVVAQHLASYGLSPSVNSKVVIASQRKVGA